MNVVTRGIRNAFRNATRTISIVFILGLSIGLSLIMLVANQAVENKIKTTLSAIGNTVTIHPAGGFSPGSSVTPALNATSLSKVKTLAHVKSLAETLSGHLQTEGTVSGPPGAQSAGSSGASGPDGNNESKTNLKSPFKLNCDKNGCSGSGVAMSGTGGTPKLPDNFSLPISVIGTNAPTDPASIGATSFKLVSGKAIDGGKDSNSVLVSSDMAKKNNLKVGSTFTAYNKTLTVAGIFESNTQTGDSTIVLSLPALQRLADQKGIITGATATIDSLENLDAATSAIKKAIGSSADVTSGVDQAAQAIQPLKSVKNISFYSLIGAVSAGATIILLTMIMIVRERKREIGVLKAIGSSNARIILQFMSEALTLTLLGTVIGVIIGIVGGNPVTSSLVNNSSDDKTPQGMGTHMAMDFHGPGLEGLKDVHATIGWPIFFYGLAAAVVIALIGSALAAALIAKVRPSEVLRSE
jgi:putative ABC transport system permease protein